MKIALLSGAYKNAGDFLIVKRSEQLLKYVYPRAEIVKYERRKSLSDRLDEINNSDYLVIAGGPAYVHNVYPDILPLVPNLNDIKVPIFALGLGWQGITAGSDLIYRYQFTSHSLQLLRRIEKDGFELGCRDLLSQRILRNAGINSTVMTGCVAWHNLKYVDQTEFRVPKNEMRKICVSDPAIKFNFDMAYVLVKYLKKRYPHAEIIFVFHRGTKADSNTTQKDSAYIIDLKQKIETAGVRCEDISYGSQGFHIYDDCDLHIGFRVHAHIYNLSIRNKSVLIEEDSRGAGVNQALGLPSILAYEQRVQYSENKYVNKFIRHMGIQRNRYVINELRDCLDDLEASEYMIYPLAFQRMKYYFHVMTEHIRTLRLH